MSDIQVSLHQDESTTCVRQACIADLPAVKHLADLNKGALGFQSTGALRSAIAGARVLVMDRGGFLAGFIEYYLRRDAQLTIYAVVVDEPCRGRGLGRDMMLYLVKQAQMLQVSRIALKCPADLEANSFYEAFGFCHEGVETRPGRRNLNKWIYDIGSVSALL